MAEPYCSNLKIIIVMFWVSEFFFIFTKSMNRYFPPQGGPHFFMVEPYCSNLKIIIVIFWESEFFGFLRSQVTGEHYVNCLVHHQYNWASSWDYGTYHIGIHAVSPELSLFSHIKYGSRQRFWPKITHLAPLHGCACAFKECFYGGRKVP